MAAAAGAKSLLVILSDSSTQLGLTDVLRELKRFKNNIRQRLNRPGNKINVNDMFVYFVC